MKADVGTLSGSTTAGTAGNLVLAVTGGSSYTIAIAATDTAASIISHVNGTSGLGSSGARKVSDRISIEKIGNRTRNSDQYFLISAPTAALQ